MVCSYPRLERVLVLLVVWLGSFFAHVCPRVCLDGLAGVLANW
jgi:hypothetical protein